jgi:hypothetical protein
MRGEAASARVAWVEELCSSCADDDHDVIPFALLRELVFPILRDRFRNGDAEAACLLATFARRLHQATDLWAEIGTDQIALLEQALVWQPTHARARRRLVDALGRAFDYAAHEVPSGVLGFRSMNGASVEECSELLYWLDRFEDLLAADGRADEFKERVAHWRFHFASYRAYQRDRGGAPSYAVYLLRQAR